jgi:hypothetical protein
MAEEKDEDIAVSTAGMTAAETADAELAAGAPADGDGGLFSGWRKD